MTRKAEPRRAVPMKTQRDLALAQLADAMRKLGMVPVDTDIEWQLDHYPALCHRQVDEATGQHIPHQHDTQYLVWMTKEAHARKTHGNGATTKGSDVGDNAHNKRVAQREVEHREAVAAKSPAAPAPAPRQKPKFKRQMAGAKKSNIKLKIGGGAVYRDTGKPVHRHS